MRLQHALDVGLSTELDAITSLEYADSVAVGDSVAVEELVAERFVAAVNCMDCFVAAPFLDDARFLSFVQVNAMIKTRSALHFH